MFQTWLHCTVLVKRSVAIHAEVFLLAAGTVPGFDPCPFSGRREADRHFPPVNNSQLFCDSLKNLGSF